MLSKILDILQYAVPGALMIGIMLKVLLKGRKKKAAPKKNEMKLATGGGESEMPDIVVKEKQDAPAEGAATTTAPRPVYPKLEIAETAIPESELRYFTPFGPRDSILDVWTKLQSFQATEAITVRLVPDDGGSPLVKSSFQPDGTLQSTREEFYELFAKNMRGMKGGSAPRSVRKLEMFGIPNSAQEASYAFFSGKLQMDLGGITAENLTFRVRATFEPNLGLIAHHFMHSKEYLHCEMPMEGAWGKNLITVGFPWTLSSIRLHCEDPRLEQASASVAKAILEKNIQHVRENRRMAPTREDENRRVSLVTDGVAVIAIEEGSFIDKGHLKRSLDIEYSAYPQGPLDEMSAGDAEFMRFAETISHGFDSVAAGQVELAIG